MSIEGKEFITRVKQELGMTEPSEVVEPHFKGGEKVAVVLYHGISAIEAKACHEYLKQSYDNHTPIPLNGSDFKIRISDIQLMSSDNFITALTTYEIRVKGELI